MPLPHTSPSFIHRSESTAFIFLHHSDGFFNDSLINRVILVSVVKYKGSIIPRSRRGDEVGNEVSNEVSSYLLSYPRLEPRRRRRRTAALLEKKGEKMKIRRGGRGVECTLAKYITSKTQKLEANASLINVNDVIQ